MTKPKKRGRPKGSKNKRKAIKSTSKKKLNQRLLSMKWLMAKRYVLFAKHRRA